MTWARWPFALVVAVALLVAVWFGPRGAFRTDAAADNPPGSSRAGDMLLVNAYAEEPSGDWAAPGADLRVYAWLFNDGDRDDRLVSVSSPAAQSVRVNGSALPVEVGAQSWVSFGPTGNYLVLDRLTSPVPAGTSVELTFTFASNGGLTQQVATVERASSATPPPTLPSPAPSS